MVPPEFFLLFLVTFFAEFVFAFAFELAFRFELVFLLPLTATPANARNAESEVAVRITRLAFMVEHLVST